MKIRVNWDLVFPEIRIITVREYIDYGIKKGYLVDEMTAVTHMLTEGIFDWLEEREMYEDAHWFQTELREIILGNELRKK